MNLTEKMALDCGVKIGQPHVDRLFMPIKNENFIIIDTRSKYENGEYDYFLDVYDLVKRYLKEYDVDVYQFATEKSVKIPCTKCFITINKKQEAYLISKAKLIVANENYSLHLASIFNTKSIGLYSIYNAENTRPIWNKQSQIVLESDRDGNLPTYNQLSEKPKTINFISPYVIAKNILDQLNIPNELGKLELVHIGKNYSHKVIEVVPDFISDENFLKDKQINLRLDYVKSLSLNVLNYWLANKKVNLITDKDINVNLLVPHRGNIQLLTVILSENISEKFLKQCKSIGLKIKLYCDVKDKLNEYRFKFLDWEIEKDFTEESEFKKIPNLTENCKFISSKVLVSKGKQFSCKANYLINKNIDNREESVILSEEFEKELDFFKIYNERKESTSSTPIA
jgi:hypothetical protein